MVSDKEYPDARVLEDLRNAGSNLSKPHPIDFFLYFPLRRDAEEVARVLYDEGFQAKVERSAGDGQSLCIARKEIVPTHEAISFISAHLEEMVLTRNGEYDGWETKVIR